MKKVYSVQVTIGMSIPVAASSKAEAESIASKHYREELRNGTDDVSFHAAEIKSPGDFDGCIPWGSERDLTVNQILAGETK